MVNKGLLLSMVGNLYVSLFGGIVLVVLFIIWAVAFLRTLMDGKENTNLQKMYGQEYEKAVDSKKKRRIVKLVIFGGAIACLVMLYSILL